MNCLSLIGEIRDFFIHPKRKNVLSHKILDSSNDTTKKTLKRSCATKWIECYHAVHDFLELFEFIVEYFSEISEWNDNDTSGKAQRLQKSMLDGEFIISLLILSKGFGFGLPLSKHLQKVDIDLKLAIRLADETLEEMKCFRNNGENSFKKIYTAAHHLAAQFQVEITIPRVIGRQVHRMNIQAKSTEEYYRISIFNPYMDSYITELEQRFVNHKIKLNNFQSLFDAEENEDKFIQLADDYKDDLEFTNHSLLSTEYTLWQRRLKNMGKKPENALQAMTVCNKEMYPSVFKHYSLRFLLLCQFPLYRMSAPFQI